MSPLWPDFALARAAWANAAERGVVRDREAEDRDLKERLHRRVPRRPISTLLIYD